MRIEQLWGTIIGRRERVLQNVPLRRDPQKGLLIDTSQRYPWWQRILYDTNIYGDLSDSPVVEYTKVLQMRMWWLGKWESQEEIKP